MLYSEYSHLKSENTPRTTEEPARDVYKRQGWVCQIVTQARKLSQKSLYHLVPIVPGVAYGRMIHRHHFHLLAITQKISTCSNRITIHYDAVSYTHLPRDTKREVGFLC